MADSDKQKPVSPFPGPLPVAAVPTTKPDGV